MPAFNIRDVDEKLLQAFDVKARQAGFSREAYIKELMAREVGDDPGLCFGYFKLDRPGDFDEDNAPNCVQCSQPVRETWFAVMGDRTLYGPLCDLCASSE